MKEPSARAAAQQTSTKPGPDRSADQGSKPSPGLDRAVAAEWSRWFAALGDPTRVLILHLLATAGQALSVGEITDRLDVGQSTVSHHLAKLADVGFVLVDQVGTSSRWQVNQACLQYFPSAAEVVMGRVNAAFVEAVADCVTGPTPDPATADPATN
jgi:DNA-binding transcriptional ArsR family regulator